MNNPKVWGEGVWHIIQPPTTTPKLKHDFRTYKIFVKIWCDDGGSWTSYHHPLPLPQSLTRIICLSNFGVMGVVWPAIPPLHHHHSKTQLDFLDLDNFLVNFWVVVGWGGMASQTPPCQTLGWWWGGMACHTTPAPPLPQNETTFGLNFLVNIWGDGGGGVGDIASHTHPTTPKPNLTFWT